MMDESGNALALKIVELYEERDSLKTLIDSSQKDFAEISKRYYECKDLLEAYRYFYKDICDTITSENSYKTILKTIEDAARSMLGIDKECEKMLDETGIKLLGGE